MSISKKILLPAMIAMLSFSATGIAGAEEAEKTSEEGKILFRIENIKPVLDENGITKKCTFIVTAYNRMDKKVSNAKLHFKWEDNIYKKYNVEKGEIKVNTGKDAKTLVETDLEIENIAPHSQKSFSGSVETNKCFLLFDNLEYSAENCMIEGEKVEMKDSKVIGGGTGCVNNFDYINSKNPEYYSEFKDIPASVLEKQIEEEKKSDLANINKNYDNTIVGFDRLNQVLDSFSK